MKKVLLAFTVLLILSIATLFTQKYLTGREIFLFQKISTVTIDGHNFKATVVSSQQERETGLSETKSLSQNQGMIFIFDKPDYYHFWMKDMKFPIDIIYINKDQIVTIINNADPIKDLNNPTIYLPSQPADKVLEVKAGLANAYGFKNSDKVTYENISN